LGERRQRGRGKGAEERNFSLAPCSFPH